MIEDLTVAGMAAHELREALEGAFQRAGTIRIALDSSAIESVSYNTDDVFTITFTDGTTYTAPPGLFSRDDFVALATAPSAGAHWNRFMRGRR
jgi:KTSC domain